MTLMYNKEIMKKIVKLCLHSGYRMQNSFQFDGIFFETKVYLPHLIARWIPIFSILIIYTAFSFGWGSIPYALQGELLPARARSFGAGLLGFVDNLVLFFVTKSVPSMFALLGVHGTFLLSACCASAMLIVSFFCMPETMGMTLEEIEDMYRPKSKKQLSAK